MSYNTSNYRAQGGANEVINGTLTVNGTISVESGGKIQLKTGSSVVPNGGTQAATIADAEVAHALNSTFSDTEVETALDALGAKINSILAALEGAGVLASS